MVVVTELAGGSLLLIGALIALVIGLRGRRCGDEPHCRRCGYDLRGMNDRTYRCSECGAYLRARGAIRIGVWRPRWRIILVLALPSLLVGVICTVHGARVLRNTDFTMLKPVWLLRRDLSSSSPIGRSVADRELFRRLGANELSTAQIASIAAHVPPSVSSARSIPGVCVDCAARAWRDGSWDDDAQAVSLRTRMIDFSVSVWRSMDHYPIGIDVNVSVAAGHATTTGGGYTITEAAIDGRPVDCQNTANFIRGGGTGAANLLVPPKMWDTLKPPGRHVLRLTLRPMFGFTTRPRMTWTLPERTIETTFEVVDLATEASQ